MKQSPLHLGRSWENTSPRGVLDMLVSGLDEKSGELSNLQWKKMFGQVKKTSSVWKISTISLRRRMQGRRSNSEDAGDFVMPKPSWRNFSYEELRHATDCYNLYGILKNMGCLVVLVKSRKWLMVVVVYVPIDLDIYRSALIDKLIGKGGHAEVYKGKLYDGQVVAVKKIMKGEKNGDFLAELGIIAHIDHPNTAKLIGFSADQGLLRRLSSGLGDAIQGGYQGGQRRIIHRDITASNILLSEDYEAQISDFGLAKWLPEGWAHLVVTPIEGTFGYMAPEYFMHRLVNGKTDVFAFGVLLLELITGRRAVDSSSQSLAKPHLENNSVEEIADPRLGGNYNVTEMKRAMFTASTCENPSTHVFVQVVQPLKGDNGLDMKQI
ncbi:hypothetical protein SASPL_145057 [Salvia splendens]|uniref:Protein kinase domain-containing protein n=1 Tax=Salvia splendens TaxID=180675 RepID=A0A8X8Z7T3_SALSN|nr:hypothetical protein SASPL_145057 [Salvia splendens]